MAGGWLNQAHKCSVSYLIGYAVKKYLKSIVEKEEVNSYSFINYIVSRNTIDGIITWQIFWGYPREIEKYVEIPINYLDENEIEQLE